MELGAEAKTGRHWIALKDCFAVEQQRKFATHDVEGVTKAIMMYHEELMNGAATRDGDAAGISLASNLAPLQAAEVPPPPRRHSASGGSAAA